MAAGFLPTRSFSDSCASFAHFTFVITGGHTGEPHPYPLGAVRAHRRHHVAGECEFCADLLQPEHNVYRVQDDNETRWFTLKAGELAYDPSTQNFFALKQVTRADVQVWLDKAEETAH